MTDSIAIALACVWLLCPLVALGVLRLHYRRELRRERSAAYVAIASGTSTVNELRELDWAPEWGPDWP